MHLYLLVIKSTSLDSTHKSTCLPYLPGRGSWDRKARTHAAGRVHSLPKWCNRAFSQAPPFSPRSIGRTAYFISTLIIGFTTSRSGGRFPTHGQTVTQSHTLVRCVTLTIYDCSLIEECEFQPVSMILFVEVTSSSCGGEDCRVKEKRRMNIWYTCKISFDKTLIFDQ